MTDELGGDVVELAVAVLADPGQHQECALRADLVTLYQDALGLADQVAAGDGLGELGLLPDGGEGDRGVGRKEQPTCSDSSSNA